MLKCLIFTLLFVALVFGDCYMHNPRGSNNRLNEQSENRNNNNRMFDSQNNAKGGYCWGPPMHFYGGSRLGIEWTNQHGCGNPNMNCDIVIQYMCQDNGLRDEFGWQTWDIRDGVTTQTPDNDFDTVNNLVTDPEDFIQMGPFRSNGTSLPDYQGTNSGVEPARLCTNGDPTGANSTCQVYERGMHESYEYYDACQKRERNQGLFTADQNLNGNTAQFTRQNPNGGRSGLECPEERDYYPYWHPSPWIDIVVLTDDTARCNYYQQNSGNNNDKGYCTVPQYNNEPTCTGAGGEWNSHNFNQGKPDCTSTPWNRDNHLGNGRTGYTNSYNWTIPNIDNKQCVLRMRYNISSGDYDGWGVDAASNGDASPVTDDPYVTPFDDRELRLAIDTTQFGRTFQDRSYMFEIRSRPSDITSGTRMWNLNVRGKRGNIVQAYPAVEYDFTPNRLEVRVGDYIHFQWTGCDNNPQGNDGEGTRGTDRSNMILLDSLSENYPGNQGFFSQDSDHEAFGYLGTDAAACKAALEALRADTNNNDDDINRDPTNCAKLNAASRYFDGGLIKIDDSHNFNTYYYMSTRNNNFTNRSQKGTITVTPFLPIWAIVLVCFGGLVFLGSFILLGLGIWGRIFPDGKISSFMGKLHG